MRDIQYISVGELSEGFSENMLQSTDELVGKQLTLFYEDSKTTKLSFIDIDVLKLFVSDKDGNENYVCSYKAITPRENIYFVDFIVSYGDTKSVSIILDMSKKIATVVTAVLPTFKEMSVPLIERAVKALPLTAVKSFCEHASVDAPFTHTTPRHELTEDLIGKKIQFTYSSKDVYEHIYLNENTYTWHCTSGKEKGMSDTDRCFYYKVDENLYLFFWVEKIIPTLGLVIEDLAAMRSYGKIFGYEEYDAGRISNFPVGSYAKILNI